MRLQLTPTFHLVANFGSRWKLSAFLVALRFPLSAVRLRRHGMIQRLHIEALVPVLTEWLMCNGPSGYLRTGAA